ncbi:MAG: ASKHA domain-containing protein [Sphaerochaetaceae bacterium]
MKLVHSIDGGGMDDSKTTFQVVGDGQRTVLEWLDENGCSGVVSPCGGNGLCGKCLVRIVQGDAGKICADEERQLADHSRETGFRLACRTVVPQGNTVEVEIPGAQSSRQILSGFDRRTSEPVGREPLPTDSFGWAVDIGTTTVVVYLVDLTTKAILDNRCALNLQQAFGADVISRIQYAQRGARDLVRLQQTIVGQLDRMMADLCKAHAVSPGHLVKATAVGNPTMLHLLLGVDPSGIARAPFIPAFTAQKQVSLGALGFRTAPQADLYLPGSVSAYVGSDITAGIQTTSMVGQEKPILYIDIGTNGEIALWDGETLHCCSSAAGPAFEGASISQGLGAVDGAIDHLWLQDGNRLAFSTLGGRAPIGLCGSGIIDVMALMLDLGLVDSTGSMRPVADDTTGLLFSGPSGPCVRICPTVVFTHRDVREVQLAKAAIAAGIQTLLHESGLTDDRLSSLLIAGGFGAFIDTTRAQSIGLLPQVDPDLIHVVGNAAGKGAIAALLSASDAEQIEYIRSHARYHELSSSPLFQELYIEQMFFPTGEGS